MCVCVCDGSPFRRLGRRGRAGPGPSRCHASLEGSNDVAPGPEEASASGGEAQTSRPAFVALVAVVDGEGRAGAQNMKG